MNDSNVLERAEALLKQEFGADWKHIAQNLGTRDLRRRVGKDLTSFMAFPERGEGGDNRWRGNCSPEVVAAITKYVLDCKIYNRKDISSFTLLDPMSGSGSSKAAADRLGVRSLLYDLNPTPPHGKGGWDALTHDVDDSADLIFLHPPYHDIIQYSGHMWGGPHPDDLSRCASYQEFMDKLNFVVRKLFLALRKDGRMAILVGDIRTKGSFYSIQRDLQRLGSLEAFVVKSQFNCVSDSRTYKKPFIPVVTEYMLVYHKEDALLVPIAWQRSGEANIQAMDSKALSWHHLIRMTMESLGGRAKLSELAHHLSTHPKARGNEHFRERIRATIYEHKDQYVNQGGGWYALPYQVA